MRVLVTGDWSQAKVIFPKDTKFDVMQEELPVDEDPYEAIFLGHCLQQLNLSSVVPFLESLVPLLDQAGEIWVTVPSLEWAARQIVTKDEPSMAVPLLIYGTISEPNRCGFTMIWLRVAMQNAGFTVRKAVQEAYQLNIEGVGQYMAVQNLLIGMKHNAKSD